MAALTPRWIGRKTNDTNDGSSRELTYIVECNALTDTTDTAKAAVLALGLPAGYRTESCEAVHRERNPLWFVVTWRMKTSWESLVSDNPLDRPSVLTASWDEEDEAYFTDSENTQVVNYAGDRFDPLPNRKQGHLVLQITKNLSAFNAPGYDLLKYHRNAAAITIRGTIYPINSLLFLPPTVQEQHELVSGTTYDYFAVTFRLAVDQNLHTQSVEDRGYNQIYNGEYIPILDKAGIPVTSPWPLNADGTAKVSVLTPEIRVFKPYASVAWGINFD